LNLENLQYSVGEAADESEVILLFHRRTVQ